MVDTARSAVVEEGKIDYLVRYRLNLHPSEVFCTRFNYEGSYLANSYMDGSLMLVNPLMGDKLHLFKDEKMTYPITRLAWQHIY
jgi:hypothetical protein